MLIKILKALGAGLAIAVMSGCSTVCLDPDGLCGSDGTNTSLHARAEVVDAMPARAPAPPPAQLAPIASVETRPVPLPGEDAGAPPADARSDARSNAQSGPRSGTRSGAIRVALLLPMRSSSLGAAAESVRAGFMASVERDGAGFETDLLATGDDPADAVAAYVRAAADHDLIVGPLARPAVDALAASGKVTRPTVILNHPDPRAALPTLMLVAGLSLEDEARQAAEWAAREHPHGRALILTGNAAWAPRVTAAFEARWSELGHTSQHAALPSSAGRVDPASLDALKTRLDIDPPELLFSALDVAELRQVRATAGAGIPCYAGGPGNPGTAPGADFAALDGLRLVDVPWLIQPDNRAVMVYPRPAESAQPLYMDRLYALGIDAFRVAHDLALHPGSAFAIDGVTGHLAVDAAADHPQLRRREAEAVYHGGVFDAVDPAR